MAALYESTLKNITEGTIVPGKIAAIRENEVLVDIGYKSEGIISASEFKDLETLKPGDQVEVYLENLEDDQGMVVLSKRRAEQQRNWDRVLANFVEGSIITGTIKGRVKGGMIVDVGVDAFLPGSQVDMMSGRGSDDVSERELEFKIIKINRERRNIVVSRRELLEERRREQKKELLSEIKIGETRRGVVKNITDFGAFVDLNGMDGLLHITDMSWGRVNHPSEVVKVGQEIDVMILDVDREKDRISLGLKQSMPNPWDDIERKYPVGTRISGKVVNLVPYGAFVEIEEGVEGMVHVSEISWTKRVAKASDALALGQQVDAVILNINKDEQKISLGIRQTEANPWQRAQEHYPIGSRIKGVVRNFTSYGAFVELEPGIDGMIHVSDMSWTRKVNHPSEMLKKGDEVEAVVLEVDAAQQRISLGLKQAQTDPWAGIATRYQIGQLVKGKVSKLASFGAFVEIEEGIDGLVHISQISEERVQKVRDALQPGQEVEARVIKIDTADRRIGLSIKAAKLSDEEFKVDESMLEGLRPGEDLVDLAGAFDEALSAGGAEAEEWHPGQK
ncbi:MAG TPA: 30S ribosomal protein S1 [Kiritimatiellia bacterium]|nr:30S ribosomal protein S1 [Kiritimatiellia bacterium]HMO98588.1 30S ribosomal protein S1 [Kiritimatiellia bacterium]HMP95433.1 30S ribosomal protein S1 [Kiritimatiellia bacterium]